MMLAAIPASHSPSVFAHTGSSPTSLPQSVISPESSPEGHRTQLKQQVQEEGQAFLASSGRRPMDSSKVPLPATGQVVHSSTAPQGQAQLIPLHQSFILNAGGGAAGYILPSITQLGNLPSGGEGAMIGIQPLSAIPSIPRPMSIQSTPVTGFPPATVGYYGSYQSDTSSHLPFHPQSSSSSSNNVDSLRTAEISTVGAAIPPPALTRVASSPQQQHQGLQLSKDQQQHAQTTAIASGILPRPSILSGSHQSSMTTAPPSSLQPASSPIISRDNSAATMQQQSILSPSQQGSTLSQSQHSLLDDTNSPSATSVSAMSPSPSSDSIQHNQPQLIDHSHQQQSAVEDHQQHRARKRLPHADLGVSASYTRSRAVRQATRFSPTALSAVSVGDSTLQGCVRVKREPEDVAGTSSNLLHSARRNSDSNLEESVSSSSKSYQISALIDVPPMMSALNRASRTSSLSSSISSIRFGGSLNQLWPPALSVGKVNDMKSTGNLAAEAAVLPSLNNQYFAFGGGSLPELSLTSLTRLLPNSSANDGGFPSCHVLLTHPMYVYTSQQQLATPIINSHGSINFGSFLSNGPNLCTTSKGSPGIGGGAEGSSTSDMTSSDSGKKEGHTEASTGRSAESTNSEEQEVDVGCNQSGMNSSAARPAAQSPLISSLTSSAQESVVKMPTVYSPLSTSLLTGVNSVAPGVITTLPTFGMLTRVSESSNQQSPPDRLTSSLILNSRATSLASSPPTSMPLITNAGMEAAAPLGGHIMHQLHPQQAQVPHPPPPSHSLILPLHNSQSHLHSATSPSVVTDDQHLHAMSPPTQPDLYLTPEQRDAASRSGPGGGAILQRGPMSGSSMGTIKLESDMELDYESSLNIHPIVPTHETGRSEGVAGGGMAGSALHSPTGDQQQVLDQHMLQGSSAGLISDRTMAAMKKEKDKPYKCDHPGCGRTFSFPAHLRSHIQQIHISYRPCKCEFPGCGKRFYTPQHLNVHRRVHTGERPFVCPYTDCSKAFTTAGNLKNHIRTHTGERPYACKFEGCSKRFAEMSSLKKHELTHTGEKPYKCRVCGKAFSQAGSRNTHERKHNRSEEEELSGVGVAPGGGAVSREGGMSAGLSKGSKKYRIGRVSGGNGAEDSSSLVNQP